MSTKKTTSKKKTATTKRGRRKKPATSSLFKTGTGSSSDREARDWQDILGAEAKAALDAKMKRGEAATMLSPAAALYWYSLQESMRTDGEPRSTRPLLTVARSIRDGETVRQELAAALNVPNVYEKRQRKLNSDRGRRSREMKLKWTNAEYVPTWVAAVHKAGGPWKRGAKRQGDNAVLAAKLKDKRLPKRMNARERKNALDGIARYMREHVGSIPWKDVVAAYPGEAEGT